jgi:putative inorganic carbon (HCO3(-)) transporter
MPPTPHRESGKLKMASLGESNRVTQGTPGISQFHFQNVARFRRELQVKEEAGAATPVSYRLLLVFLLLLYANTPFLFPALEVIRPAALVGGAALFALLGEMMFGTRKFEAAWPEGALLAAFVAAAALSCLTALWPRYAVDWVSDLVKMTLVYFFLVNCANTERRLRGVMWVMVIGGLFPALGTLKNYYQGNLQEGRAAWLGIFGNPNEVAYSLVILFPLAAYLAAPRGWVARLVLLGLSIVYLPAIFVTFSRGGVVGLVAVIGLYAWRQRTLWLQAVLVLMVAGGLALAGRYWSRGEDFSQLGEDVSFRQRIATSQAGLNMFVDHPWLGVGPGCSVIAWPLYAPQGLYTRGALVTHNTIVQVFSETGILGAIPFLLLIGFGLYHTRRLALNSSTANLGIAIEVAIWGLVICGMSGGYALTWFPYILLGLAAAARRLPGESA